MPRDERATEEKRTNREAVVAYLRLALDKARNGYNPTRLTGYLSQAQFLVDDDAGLIEDAPF